MEMGCIRKLSYSIYCPVDEAFINVPVLKSLVCPRSYNWPAYLARKRFIQVSQCRIMQAFITAAWLAQLGERPVCLAGRSRVQTPAGTTLRVSDAFAMTSVNGQTFQSSRIRTKNRRPHITSLSLHLYLLGRKRTHTTVRKEQGKQATVVCFQAFLS